MNNLMGDEFGCLDALKITNCNEKKGGNGVQEPLYRKLKTRGMLSRPNIEEKIWTVGLEPHRWMLGA